MKKLLRLISLAALAVAPLFGQTVYQNVQAASGTYTDNTVFRRDGTANRAQTSGIVIEDTGSNNTTIGGVDANTDVTLRGGTGGATVSASRSTSAGSITLTTSGTGGVALSGSGLAGSGLLRFPAGTTNAFGIGFNGGTAFLFSNSSGGLTISKTSGDNQLTLDNSTSGHRYTTLNFNNNGTLKAFADWDQTDTAFDVGTNANSAVIRFRAGSGTLAATLGTATFAIEGATFSSTAASTFTISSASGQSIALRNGVTAAVTYESTAGNATMLGKFISYNGLAVEGNGVAAIQKVGRSTAQVAAVANVATYTVGAADASFLVSSNVLVTTSTTHSFTVTVAYTDEGNTGRTLTLSFAQPAGTIATAITNVTGAGPYEGVPLHIRAKASTNIVFATTGTFTTVAYNVEGVVTKLQ